MLKDDGIIIHIVPTTWWSLLTNLFHYCFIPKYIFKSFKKRMDSNSNQNEYNNSFLEIILLDISKKQKIKILFSHPLGVNPIFMSFIIFQNLSGKNYFKKMGLR